MSHYQQTRPPRARPVWQNARHPSPKRPQRCSCSLLELLARYAPK